MSPYRRRLASIRGTRGTRIAQPREEDASDAQWVAFVCGLVFFAGWAMLGALLR